MKHFLCHQMIEIIEAATKSQQMLNGRLSTSISDYYRAIKKTRFLFTFIRKYKYIEYSRIFRISFSLISIICFRLNSCATLHTMKKLKESILWNLFFISKVDTIDCFREHLFPMYHIQRKLNEKERRNLIKLLDQKITQ